MASVRNLAISIHRLTGAPNIAKALRNEMRNSNIAPPQPTDFEKTLQNEGVDVAVFPPAR
jgi:hypothetical protein